MFIPKHKRKDNLKVNQEPLVDKVSGEFYYGPYFETSNGKKYTGTTPFTGNTRELEELPEDTVLPGTDDITIRAGKNTYDLLRNDPTAFNLKLTLPLPIYFPTEIPAGTSFKRYFAKDTRTEKIVEISSQTYTDLKNKDSKYYYPNFAIAEVIWVVEGPVEDTNTGSYIIPGVATQNKNAIQKAEKTIPGLSDYITDYLQFVR